MVKKLQINIGRRVFPLWKPKYWGSSLDVSSKMNSFPMKGWGKNQIKLSIYDMVHAISLIKIKYYGGGNIVLKRTVWEESKYFKLLKVY